MKPLSLIVLLLGGLLAQTAVVNAPGGGAPPAKQTPFPSSSVPSASASEAKLPNGKSQRDEIAKADYKKNLDDATELLKLATDLQSDLDKQGAYIVSLKSIKQTEDIEKLAKNIRGRLKRY
jgi:hypothetical protein